MKNVEYTDVYMWVWILVSIIGAWEEIQF